MRNIELIIAFLFFGNFLFGQDVIKLSGKSEMTANPCITEICLPGLVWSLKVDTATLILTKNKNWIWDENPLMIYEIGYSEGDSVELYGQLSKNQDWNGEDYYEFEIVNKEQSDTIISNDSFITLVFSFPIFECGINVFEHPSHYSTSELTYNGTLVTANYSYSPLQNFIGTDTVVFLTGCGYPPDYNSVKIIEYLIHVSEGTKINTITNNTFRLFPNPSSGKIHIKNNEDLIYGFIINNLQGQRITQGEFRQDLILSLRQGVYIISIIDDTKVIFRQKIIISE